MLASPRPTGGSAMSIYPTIENSVAVYATHDQAETSIRILKDSGFDMKSLSIVGQDYQTLEHPIGFVNTGDRMLTWSKYGAFWGTMWGLLFGSAMVFVPAVGPVMLAGYIVSALEGALIGGAFGAIGGALTTLGIPKNTVVEYESALKAGSYLLIVTGTPADVKRAKDLLIKTPAMRVDTYPTIESNDLVAA
jgi:Protein of unknown function (DUF1269)